MPKSTKAKTEEAKTEAKTPEDDFSTVHEIKGNLYNLSNPGAVKDLLARFSGPRKCEGLVKGLIKSICHKKLPKSSCDYQVRQIERLTLSDEDYKVKLAKKSEKKKSDTPPSDWMKFSRLVYANSKELEKIKKIEQIKAVGGPATSLLWKGYKSETSEEDRNEESMKSYISKMNDKTYTSLLKKFKISIEEETKTSKNVSEKKKRSVPKAKKEKKKKATNASS